MVKPDVAVISNIGDAHIQNLGSREGILEAKCEIFTHLKKDGLVVLNGDDALLDTVAVPFRTVRCGKSEHCQARLTEISDHGVEGIRCTVATEKDRYPLDIPAPGEHMAYGGGRGPGPEPGGDCPGGGGLRSGGQPDAGAPPAGQADAPGRLLQRQSPVRGGGPGNPGPDGVRQAGGRPG